MLATSIGVDGAVERQVGRRVAADDRLGRFDPYLGALGRRHLLEPAVILRNRMARGEAVLRIVRRATALLRCWKNHGLPLYCIHIQYRAFIDLSSTSGLPTSDHASSDTRPGSVAAPGTPQGLRTMGAMRLGRTTRLAGLGRWPGSTGPQPRSG